MTTHMPHCGCHPFLFRFFLFWSILLAPLAAQSFGDFAYSSDGAAITITGYTGAGGAVMVPGTIAGLPVKSIGEDAFRNKISITSVTLPVGVTNIGASAFWRCTRMTEIELPDSLASIGTWAFNECESLSSVIIPSGVTVIPNYAFYYCSGLTSVTIPASVVSIREDAFAECGLIHVTIPSSVTTIEDSAFLFNRNLKWAFFEGNAPPSFGGDVFLFAAPDFTIYYRASHTGFASPTWQGYPALALGDPAPLSSAGQIFLLDFGADATPTSTGAAPTNDPVNTWNNIPISVTLTDNGQYADLRTTDNTPTPVTLQMSRRFNAAGDNGAQNSSIFPINATRDSLFGNTAAFNGLSGVFPQFRLTNLDAGRTYNFTFYSSRVGVADNRETQYQITGANSATVFLNAANNVDNVVSSAGILPNDSNEIEISLSPGPNNTNSTQFTYLGVLRIEGEAISNPPPETALMAGTLDADFDPQVSHGTRVNALAVQPDGKIVIGGNFGSVGGQARAGRARLLPDGSVEDASGFHPGTDLDGQVICLAVQEDGKILMGGEFTAVDGQPRGGIARLLPDGTLESAAGFNTGTGANGAVHCLVVQPDGKILLSGNFTEFNGQPCGRIARLHPDGSLEGTETFDPGSGADNVVHGLAVQEDWKIIMVGGFLAVDGQTRRWIARLWPDGRLESTATFDVGAGLAVPGTMTSDTNPFCVQVQPDGKILVGGGFTLADGQPRNAIARLHPDGRVESLSSFNIGTGVNTNVRSMALQADGKVLLAGPFTGVNGQPRAGIARLLPDGALEDLGHFDAGTGPDNPTLSVAQQADGRVLIGGSFTAIDGQARLMLARLHNDEAVQNLVIPDPARVRWYRGGSAPEVSAVSFDYSTDGGANWTALGPGQRIDGGWERASLSLPRSGIVRARGRTTGGTVNGSSSLVEQRQLFLLEPGVITEGVSELTATSAVLRGAVLLAASTAAYFEYGPTAALGQRTAAQATGAGAATAVILPVEGLQGNIAYHYRLVAEDGAGGRTIGATATFTTMPGWPLAATGTPANVTTATATLVGGVNPQGLATQVFFEYGTTALLGSTTPAQMLPAGAVVEDIAAQLTGLNANGTYHYRIVASNAAGTAQGETVTFTATATGAGHLEPTSSPSVATGEVAVLGSESATVRGQVNARGGSTLAQVEYGLTTAYGSVTPARGVGNAIEAAEVAITLSGLRPGTTYHYRVVASNSAGTTPGADVSFTTKYPPPVAVTGGAALENTTTANVAGTVRARGALTEVYVDYGLSPASFAFSVAAEPESASGEAETAVTASLHNLTQGATYYYRVRAVSEGGTSVGAVRSFSVTALSGLAQQVPAPVPVAERQGFVLVHLSPANMGGWRLSGETTWRGSGVPATGLITGTRLIEYRPAPGHTAPAAELVAIKSGEPAVVLARVYTPTHDAATGAARVFLQPAALAAATVPAAQRAQWRLFGETTWRDSGATASGLAAGLYVIESKPVPGHATPAPARVDISGGLTTDVTLVYFLAESGPGAPPVLTPYEVAARGAATAFVGQLRGPLGSGSGFAVRPRVVATAAHVVWDEATLTFAPNLEWLYQRDVGLHEPQSFTPAGRFILAGYAAQRAAEDTPGMATPASQALDAATLFFHADVARGGSSGYLASDLPVNEYLTSTAPKVLSGYPVEGIDPAFIGRLHATPPQAVPFSAATGRTYSTREIKGYGGLSGGPLSVWNEPGQTWYPAGIYLGGSGQAVVRSLDSEVVELIRLAEAQSTGGGQHVGGGITQASSATITTNQGAIIINIEPAAARAAARWGLNEVQGRLSGARLSNIAKGTYTLKLNAVSGFLNPASPIVDIKTGKLNTYTFTYEAVPAVPTLDDWRREHFGAAATNTGEAADTADPDGDGQTNAQEFAAGTSPKNARSIFTVQDAQRTGSAYNITFDAQPNRRYELQRRLPTPGAVWETIATQNPPTAAGPVQLTDPAAPIGTAIYRVRATLP